MQLTESQKRTVEKAKHQQADWPKARWIMLAISVAMITIGKTHLSHTPESYILMSLGILQLFQTWRNWGGRDIPDLLVKLAGESE